MSEAKWLKGTEWGAFFLGWACMIKRLIVIMFALAAHGVPASAASLSPFAHDAALCEHGSSVHRVNLIGS